MIAATQQAESLGMKRAAKPFITGLILGAIIAFPLGINFGRDDPLLSNPFAKRDLTKRVTESVKQKTEDVVEGAKERLHEATKPPRE